ncbi:putative membrane protein [Rhodococcus phage Mbo2]|uniref:Membrane protein n=1 Tax=Rhodococcus phage Mbo2 TaxID=2936911 RepID=A0A9E7IEK0_9CAUD|nr:putative membrane protein [Rhodococcus phage Mbo2]
MNLFSAAYAVVTDTFAVAVSPGFVAALALFVAGALVLALAMERHEWNAADRDLLAAENAEAACQRVAARAAEAVRVAGPFAPNAMALQHAWSAALAELDVARACVTVARRHVDARTAENA